MSILVMAHLVAGFPDKEGFFQAAKGLRDGGADILELQIPFSDPTADGPVITHACEETIRNGFKVAQLSEYIAKAKEAGFERIIVMTYANIAFRYGIKKYVADLVSLGVEAALVPDLPLEDEEGFYQESFNSGLVPIPVVVINMSDDRMKMLKDKPFSKVYVSIRTGITGEETRISDETKAFLTKVRKSLGGSSLEVFAGFGIRSAAQLKVLCDVCDVAVVGSFFTQIIEQAHVNGEDIYQKVYDGMKILSS